jgi:hypothetical protein
MKMLVPGVALFSAVLLADSIPSGWIVLKDRKNICQIGAPGDFKPDGTFVGLGRGPGDTLEVQVYSQTSPVKPLSEAVAKIMGIERLIENTDKRLFYANKPAKIADGRTTTSWTVKVPRDGGNCFATISVVPGGSEELVKKIAATIGPVK